MRESFKFKDSDGVELNVYRWDTDCEKIGIVQLSHGMTENILRYDELATYLTSKGFIVYGHDHRGHGLTAKTKEDLGYIADNEGFDWLCSVESEVDKYIEDEYCNFICSSSFYYDLLRGLKEIHKNSNFNSIPKDLPIYILAGDMDPVGVYGKGIVNLYTKMKAIGINDVKYKLYKNKRHEILNEDNKAEVMNDISNWLFTKIEANN